jgi:MinD-like ATPase involved in chromosome partitioning or flagellar assembly
VSIPVLTAIYGDWETSIVAGLERSGGQAHVARRCADLAELLAVALAGLGRAALVSADLQRLDRQVVAQLTAAGVAVVGVCDPRRPTDADYLGSLGVPWTVQADAPAPRVLEALTEAVAQLARVPGQRSPSAGRTGTPGGPGQAPPAAPPPAGPPVPSGSSPAAPRPQPTAPSTVLAVWGPAGAPGRSTVAVNLAAELAALGRARNETCLLVDADTYGASVAQMLGLLDESAGLAAAVRSATSGALDVERLARLTPVVVPGLRVLTGLPLPSRWPELKPAGLDVVWQQARSLARWVVIDCGFCLECDEELSFDLPGPRRNAATLSALEAADVVVAVGAGDPIGLQRLVRGLSDLEEAVGCSDPLVVITRVRSSAVGPVAQRRVSEALGRFAGLQRVVCVPEDRESLDAALLAGRSLTEHSPSSAARQELAALAAEVAGVASPARGRRRLRPRRSLSS